MESVEVDVVSLAAEFPNDNPELHRGVSWVCLDVTGRPTAVPPEVVEPEAVEIEPVVAVVPVPVPDPEPAIDAEVPTARVSGIVPSSAARDDDDADDDGDHTLLVVEDLPPLDETASLEGAPLVSPSTTLMPPAPDDAFTVLLATLADIAIAAGSPLVASVLPALLLEGRLEHTLPDDAAEALAEAGIARGTEVTAAFVEQTRAWRAILLGTSDDFGACGNAMLDEWAADLLARLLGAPSRAATLRRDLRSHGVAAFGLVEAA